MVNIIQKGKIMSENYVVENLINGNNFFEIPEYQRAYSWEESQWAQFIDDLKNVQEKYYLGHFLFEEGADRLLVIDGQQRLTTCMIFFRAVINCLEKRGVENKIKLFKLYLFDAVREKARLKTVAYDNNFFYDLIVKNSAAKTADTKSQHNIKNALEYFEKELDKIISEEILQMAELLAHATVTYYKVNDKAMAAQVFAFQNDRGKDLSELEKIKSYLFLQVYLNSSGEKQKEAIAYIDRNFAKIYEGITKIDLHEDSVVNYFWRSRSNKGFYSEKTLSEIKEVLAETPDKLDWIQKFTSQLADAFALVEGFEKYDEDPYAVRLKQLDNMALVYPFLFKANRFGVYDFWNKTFKRLLRFLENIIFRALLRGGRAELTSRLNWMLAFTVASGLDEKISQAVAALKDDNSYWGYWGNGEMCRCLNGYFYGNRVDNYFYWQYELYRNSKNGYGSPSGIKYSDIIRSENIEHVAPRTSPGGNSVFNGYGIYTDAVNPENGIESGQWLNGIGNLMLIAESHNKSIGNCRFADKLSSYEKSSLSQQREIKEFASSKDGMLIWDVEAIKKRKNAMIEAAMEIWSLDKI